MLGIRKQTRRFASSIRKLFIRLQNRNIKFGRNVLLDKFVRIKVTGELTIGDDCTIERNVTIAGRGQISIGRSTFIGEGTIIVGREKIKIQDNCLIAAGVTIRDMSHGTELNGIPFSDQPTRTSPIQINSNVWVGTKATVLLGVSIGTNTIIGAHAVVNRDLPPNCIAVGVPAKVVRCNEPQ